MYNGVYLMEQIEWDEAMSVGEPTIDEQHKKLIKQINKLVQEIETGSSVAGVRSTLKFLNEYLNEHFKYEEEYMEKIYYSGLEKHKKVHVNFIRFTEEFSEEFTQKFNESEGGSNTVDEFAKKAHVFLGEWLVNHILDEDQKYRT